MFARGLRLLQRARAPASAAAAAAAAGLYYNHTSALSDTAPAVGLDPANWTPLTLAKVTKLSENTAIYRFAYDNPKATSGMTVASCLLTIAPIGSEKPDGSRANVMRPYTPISRPNEVGYLDLAVKTYPEGKMSKHIAELKVGEKLKFKGPIVKLPYKPNQYKEIGMVAGGTGIAPMLQVVDEVLADPADKTKVSLIFANVSEADILMKADIDKRAAAHPDKFKVYYVVDKSSSWFWRGGVGYVTDSMLKEQIPAPSDSSMVYVCGPPPMCTPPPPPTALPSRLASRPWAALCACPCPCCHLNRSPRVPTGADKAICGPKGTKEDPKAQGELGGLLAKLGYSKERVFKF